MNLLERTRRLLQGLASPSPAKVQYYSVACAEGHRLRGERTEGYQALRCPTCGEGIFVLPRSPLPEPLAPNTPRTAKAARDAEASQRGRTSEREEGPVALTDPVPSGQAGESDVDGEIEWLDPGPETELPTPEGPGPAGSLDDLDLSELDAPAPTVTRPATGRPSKPKPKPTRAEAPAPRPGRGPGGRPAAVAVAVSGRERLAAWARARRNALIFLAVGLTVLSTVGFRVWRSNFQDLPRIAERGRVEGLAALDAGDFDTAHKLLSAAKRAVNSLGGAVEGADEIRHGADEAALFASRISDPLESILADASADPQDSTWSSRFDTLYKGRAIVIIDAQVTAVPDSSDSGTYELDYRILPPGEGSAATRPRDGRLDLTGFRLFEQSRPRRGDVVRFAARLASLRLDTEKTDRPWLFGLEPDSGVYLTHPDAIEALRGGGAEDEPGEDAP